MLMGDSDTHSLNTRVQQDRAARANAAMRGTHCTAMTLFVTRATMRVTHEARRHVDVPSTYQSGSYRCPQLTKLVSHQNF